MISIDETYMSKSKEERQSHLSLQEKCIERIKETQYINSGYSYYLKGLLAHVLDTEIPVRKKVVLAHACNNARCANPKHLYWATYKENLHDSGTCYERTIKKHGKQFVIDKNRRLAKQKPPEFFSKINNRKGKSLSEKHKRNISKAIKRWYNDSI
jgi:hypothetical protein